MDVKLIFTELEAVDPRGAQVTREFLRVLAETVKEFGMAPAGTCFMAFAAHGINFTEFSVMVGLLRGAGIIEVMNHCLIWVGDEHGEMTIFGERLP